MGEHHSPVVGIRKTGSILEVVSPDTRGTASLKPVVRR